MSTAPIKPPISVYPIMVGSGDGIPECKIPDQPP